MNNQTLLSIIKLFAIATNKSNSTPADIICKFKKFLSLVIEEKYIEKFSTEFEKAIDEYSSFSEKKLSLNSVRLIKLCSDTSKNLSISERLQVLFYLIKLSKTFETTQTKEFITLIADVYKISQDKFILLYNFFEKPECQSFQIKIENEITGYFIILADDIVALKNINNHISINGKNVGEEIELVGTNTIVTVDQGKKFYLNDLISLSKTSKDENTFELIINKLSIKKRNKTLLHELTFGIQSGELIGIIGKSGSGKTTLLKAIAGIDKKFQGKIYKLKNDSASEYTKAYLPQNNSFIPLFSIREHLEQRLKFLQDTKNLQKKISDTLEKVELSDFQDNIVAHSDGSSWEISGGQQKRLGIAMELLANPEVIVLDEPCSGLSSTDTKKTIALLHKIATEQKIIIVSIHQPDYETFMTFDKILIIDDYGYPIFYGKPTLAADYFRSITNKIDKESLIETHYNPAVILDIINEKSYDESGTNESKRVFSPKQWYDRFIQETATNIEFQSIKKRFPQKYNPIKSFCSQLELSLKCDIKNKVRISFIFLIPPIIGILFSVFLRYSYSETYQYFLNPNIPALLMILQITAFFMGLVVAGHEYIFLRDYHKTENLIKDKSLSLALAKIIKYAFISAIISILLTLPTCTITGNVFSLGYLFLINWLLVFCGNLIAIILSLFFRNVSTIYLLIPLIVIPQMIFSGGLIQYENFNKAFIKKNGTPIFADIMPIRWGSEAIMTEVFMQNPIERETAEDKIILYESIKYLDYIIPEIKKHNPEKADSLQKIYKQQQKLAQIRIDSRIENFVNADSITKKFGNIYVCKILNTAKQQNVILENSAIKYSVPPIYTIQDNNCKVFLSGYKKILGKTITTYGYNSLIITLLNIALCSILIFCIKIKQAFK